MGNFEKKNSCKRLSEEKNCMQHKCNTKLMGKKGEKYPAHQILQMARKKFLMTRNHPPPSQELNGQPLIRNISSMKRSVLSPDRVENTTHIGMFLMNFELFYLLMNHFVECLLLLYNKYDFR